MAEDSGGLESRRRSAGALLMMLYAFILAIACALLSYAAAELMRRNAVRFGFTDLPNARSLHLQPTPRGGGVGFAFVVPIAIACSMVLFATPVRTPHAVLLTAASALALVSLADDRWGLPQFVRFVAQFAAAGALVSAGIVLREIEIPGGRTYALGAGAVPITVGWIVFLTNIYNFMDGIDGLAASQAIVCALAMSALALCAERSDLAIALTVLAAGVCGFLALNWPPARIFMGDVGSTFLGFLFAGWAVLTGGEARDPLPFIAWVAVLSPFLFDAAYTLVRRAVRGEPLHQAHRTHLYQQLVRGGWSHARTTCLYAALAISASVLVILYYCLQLLPAGIFLTAVLLPSTVPLIVRGTAGRLS
jgi:UDP-GlcNAc:undecaprenyl-phosphate/decaprenyl-phosphate GlcNAc-1-phosphate transferase